MFQAGLAVKDVFLQNEIILSLIWAIYHVQTMYFMIMRSVDFSFEGNDKCDVPYRAQYNVSLITKRSL